MCPFPILEAFHIKKLPQTEKTILIPSLIYPVFIISRHRTLTRIKTIIESKYTQKIMAQEQNC